MNISLFPVGARTGLTSWLLIAVLGAGLLPVRAVADDGNTNELVSVATKALTELLHSGDAAAFARSIAPRSSDYRSVASTNPTALEEGALERWDKIATNQFKAVEASAKVFVARAKALHLDFSKENLEPRLSEKMNVSSLSFHGLQSDKERTPWVQKLKLSFPQPGHSVDDTNGEFQVSIGPFLEFKGSWRCSDAVQWEAFPAGVADEKTLREMAVLTKMRSFKGITDKDDPALLKLGAALVHFIRTGDVEVYRQEALMRPDLMWAQFQKEGRGGQSRADFDRQFAGNQKDLCAVAGQIVTQLNDAGIDLKDADIQITGVNVGRISPRGDPNSVEGLGGSGVKVQLAVKSEAKARTGASVSGDYFLAIGDIMRFGEEWLVMEKIRWAELPEGVLDAKQLEQMKFENYVAEHRSLPPGTAAPEIEFTTIDGSRKMKLSDLKGKVVILDFWATWCGPCQEPMAELQKLRRTHDDWDGRVAIVPISIDDTIDVLQKHVAKRGWTNTFNVWAGDGGWKSAAPVAFRVTGVPTTYIIDAQGKINQAGHPAGLKFEQIVEGLLKIGTK